MRKYLATLFVVGLVLSPICALAANGTGHGTNGNSGNGVSGSTGNQGGGQGQGDAGGGHGHGGDGGHGDGGSHGGGTISTGGAPSVLGGTVSGGSASVDGGGTQTSEARGQYNYEALRACTSAGAGFDNLIDYRVKPDGTFVYWGVEYALPTFVQCMKDRGVQMSTAGRNELTNFGSR